MPFALLHIVFIPPFIPPFAVCVAGITVSGLGVRDLQLVNEKYKFFKGVRTSMRSGRITVRT